MMGLILGLGVLKEFLYVFDSERRHRFTGAFARLLPGASGDPAD